MHALASHPESVSPALLREGYGVAPPSEVFSPASEGAPRQTVCASARFAASATAAGDGIVDPLQERDGSLPAAGADRYHGARAGRHRRPLLGGLAQDARLSGAERLADRDRAAA